MYELKKINISSSMRVGGFVVALAYVIFAVVSMAAGNAAAGLTNRLVTVLAGVIAAGAAGVVLGALLAWFYNLVAANWGGLHLEFHLVEDRADEPAHEDSRK